ncbi:MAG: anhydro-N-acetylmuramic acid kinase, partial [Gemmatimonadetes bacterium]|nr:anhydro-N-acetylmuramic acid kinase [Gemmatimonadota bacterium]
MKIVGLMSGTSMDGIDAALLELDDGPDGIRWSLLEFRSEAYDDERRGRIREAVDGGSSETLCRLHADLGEWLAAAASAVVEQAGVDAGEVAAIGSHGHTVWHVP